MFSQVCALEVFWFWFSIARLASSSSDNVGNLSFSLLLLKRSREMENFGNLLDYQDFSIFSAPTIAFLAL